jgi:hypothetical protein
MKTEIHPSPAKAIHTCRRGLGEKSLDAIDLTPSDLCDGELEVNLIILSSLNQHVI